MAALARPSGVDVAFERLYRLHALDVYRYALAILRNQADAEDVAQTTFMNAYRALERGEEPQAPERWLIAIAHNVCRQRFRGQVRRVREVGLDVDVADQLVQPDGDDGAPSPEDIRRALGHLAFNQRAALVMRELEGRSYKEIAELLDTSVSAVETLIFRARRALREQLEGSWTCAQAEQALSKQLDTRLERDERGQLRAHLRGCADCRRIARSQRAQRSALRAALSAAQLPSSLAGLLGGGGATAGVSVAAKAAAVVVAAGVAGGVGYSGLEPAPDPPKPAPVQTVPTPARQDLRLPVAAVLAAAPPPTHAAVPRASRRTTTPDPAPTRLPPAPATTVVAPDERSAPPREERPDRPDNEPANRGTPPPAAAPGETRPAPDPPGRPDTVPAAKGGPVAHLPPVNLPEPPPVELPALPDPGPPPALPDRGLPANP